MHAKCISHLRCGVCSHAYTNSIFLLNNQGRCGRIFAKDKKKAPVGGPGPKGTWILSDDTPVSAILQQLTTLELSLAAWEERYPGGRSRYEQFVGIFDGEPRAGLWSATAVPVIAELKEILGKREVLIRELLCRGHDRAVIDAAIHKNVAQVREQKTKELLGIDEAARRKKKHRLTSREKNIVEVLRLNLKGPDYCNALEERKIPPPQAWIDEGCPVTYPLAYKIPKWRKRIQDEKHRLSKYLPPRKTPR